MLGWKLYWVENDDVPLENCFVVARSKRSAEKHDEEIADYEPGDCTAKLVKVIPPEVLEAWEGEENRVERTDDFFSVSEERKGYADDGLLKLMGAEFKYQDFAIVTILDGQNYRTASFEETYAKELPLIQNCEDLVTRVTGLPPGTWLYRGHRVSSWDLHSSIERPPYTVLRGSLSRTEYERRMFEEFKRRAIPYLSSWHPRNDWEWLSAQRVIMACRPGSLIGREIPWSRYILLLVRAKEITTRRSLPTSTTSLRLMSPKPTPWILSGSSFMSQL